MHILLAEDDPIQLELAKLSLEKLGHKVEIATNGSEAVEAYLQYKPDLMILDVTMPEKDGYQVASEIREKDPEWVPIIFLSGMNDPQDIAKGIESGGDDYLYKPIVPQILNAKMQAMFRINNMRLELKKQTIELQQAKEELSANNKRLQELYAQKEYQATHDPLTHLPNRTMFENTLKYIVTQAKRYKEVSAILFIDLDGFKAVNDNYGHQVGDELLIKVSNRILDQVRESDMVARIGGDEFVVVLSKVIPKEIIEAIGNKILTQLAKPIQIGSHKCNISGSIGIAITPEHSTDAEELVKQADNAMYKAKKSGKNQIIFHQ